MAKLKLGPITDERPVKLTVELPAAIHRDLVSYGKLLARETGQDVIAPAKLVGPMLARFMAADRSFVILRHAANSPTNKTSNEASLREPAQ